MNLQDLWPEIRCDIEEGEEEGSAGEEETKKEKKKKRKERKKKRNEKGELEFAREKGKKKWTHIHGLAQRPNDDQGVIFFF